MGQGIPKKDLENKPLTLPDNMDYETKENLNSVDFCFCLTLSRSSFYLFLNVLDLVYATLVTMLAILFTIEDTDNSVIEYVKVSLSTLNVLLFFVAAMAFIVFLTNLKFNSLTHKIYSIIRLTICGIR